VKSRNVGPRWETAVLVVSFLLLWAWLLARGAALKSGAPMPFWWTPVQILALLALVTIFVRRTRRTVRAIRENWKQ